VQSPEFLDNQCLHARLFALRNKLCHGLLNAGKPLKFRDWQPPAEQPTNDINDPLSESA
jgi:hypothetical protein